MIERNRIITPARVEALSDGVIAIAITLLILEIRLPEIPEGSSLWLELVGIFPNLIAYLVSFLTIGVMWINHHHLFRVIRRVDQGLLILNTLLLLMITFVDFPTDLVGDYFGTEHFHSAVIFYTGTFAVTAVVFNVLWRYASYRDRLLDDDADLTIVTGITRAYNIGLGAYVITFLVAFISPWLAIVITFGLAVFFAVPFGANSQSPRR